MNLLHQIRKEPEILADAPNHGLEPGRPLPLLLLVKDAHRYPITLERVAVAVETGRVRATISRGSWFTCP